MKNIILSSKNYTWYKDNTSFSLSKLSSPKLTVRCYRTLNIRLKHLRTSSNQCRMQVAQDIHRGCRSPMLAHLLTYHQSPPHQMHHHDTVEPPQPVSTHLVQRPKGVSSLETSILLLPVFDNVITLLVLHAKTT